MEKLKIIHLLTADQGGAAIAAMRLHEGLLHQQHDSELLVLHKFGNSSKVKAVNLSKWQRLFFLIKNKIQFSRFRETLHANKYFFRLHENLYSISTKDILNSMSFKPNYIVVHWVTGFIIPRHLRELQEITNATIVYNHLDMGLFTGGCHYSFGCKGYEIDCFKCPAVKNDALTSKAQMQLQNRKENFPKKSLSVVPSALLDEQASNSLLFKNVPYKKILIGLDAEIYKPGDKLKLREQFGIPLNKRVILFGAETINDERKGFDYLKKSLEKLSVLIADEDRKNIVLVVIGKQIEEKAIFNDIAFSYYIVPYAKNVSDLIAYYQLADFFVCPSVEDSGPMMINESMMCGLPVVAFDNGVARDLITDLTGKIVKIKDVDELTNAIKHFALMSDEDIARCKDETRINALAKIQVQQQVINFVDFLTEKSENE